MENFILKKMVVTDIIVLFASMMWIFSSSDVYALRSGTVTGEHLCIAPIGFLILHDDKGKNGGLT